LAGVYASLDELKRLGWAISDAHIVKGIRNVKENTGLRGRWDKMGSKPDIYADTGHNEAGIAEVLKMIDRLNFEKLHWVWGMVSDKDYAKILSMLPKTAQYYFCKPNIPRGLDVSVLHEAAQKLRLRGRTYGSVRRALAAARKAATPNDVILIGGSTFVVAEVV
jgi:dihydrofolate synthase/folylpolyglutamate synthase